MQRKTEAIFCCPKKRKKVFLFRKEKTKHINKKTRYLLFSFLHFKNNDKKQMPNGPFLGSNGEPNSGSNISGNPTNLPFAPPNYSNDSQNASSENRGRRGPFLDKDFDGNQPKDNSSVTGANYRVVLHREVKAFSPNQLNDEKSQKHMVMFTKKSNFVQNGVRGPRIPLDQTRNSKKKERSNLYTMMNLPSLNHALFKLHQKEVRQGIEPEDRMQPEDILQDVYCEGSVVTERGGEARGKRDVYGDRLINNCIRGRAEVFNHWGRVNFGQRLYFIVKRFNTDRMLYNLIGDLDPVDTKEPRADGMPIQFVPWTHRHNREPSLEDLEYLDNDGTIRYGKVIFFGKVEKMTSNEYFGHFDNDKDQDQRCVCPDLNVC